jgi:hypothetical protein
MFCLLMNVSKDLELPVCPLEQPNTDTKESKLFFEKAKHGDRHYCPSVMLAEVPIYNSELKRQLEY